MQVVNNCSKYQSRKFSNAKGKWLPKTDLQCNNLVVFCKVVSVSDMVFFSKIVLVIEKNFPKSETEGQKFSKKF